MASPTVEPGCASSGREVVLLLWQPEAVAWESGWDAGVTPRRREGRGDASLGSPERWKERGRSNCYRLAPTSLLPLWGPILCTALALNQVQY